MNHETLQRLFNLDVAEVGKVEAAKRWEYFNGSRWEVNSDFNENTLKPTWCEGIQYRRKPDLPWPKVMDSKKVQELESYICNELRDLKIDTEQTAHEWPSDAPEWANYMAMDEDGITYLFENKPSIHCGLWDENGGYSITYTTTHPNWRDSLIERPKPVKQKINWSKLGKNIIGTMWNPSAKYANDAFPSQWFAWNCNENTRGNPLPDGVVVEWIDGNGAHHNYTPACWGLIRCFRIVGIQEGWE